jgi:PKD domain/Thrombospondin type 3 repeat
MKIDLKNKFHILIILIASVISLMSLMVVLSPLMPGSFENDVDHDGIKDDVDNCPTINNPDQSDSDADGIGDMCDTCTDTDGDGYGNPGYAVNTCPADNCPTTPNSNQTDTDHDTIGDACDDCPNDPLNDVDNDGICGDVDNCPDLYNPGQNDSDADGIGDACEIPPTANFTYTPLYPIVNGIIQFWDNTTLGGGVLHYWQWTFGDNTSSNEQHPKHQYTHSGVYIIQLKVTDINCKTNMTTRNVTVNNPPNQPTIIGPSSGKTWVEYNYTFKTTDPDEDQIYYFIYWGDNSTELYLGPYNSGYEINEKHSWVTEGRFTIRVKARDTKNAESIYVSLPVLISKNIFILHPGFSQHFEKYHEILFFKILFT